MTLDFNATYKVDIMNPKLETICTALKGVFELKLIDFFKHFIT